MKKWHVSDIRWASESELKLPFWQKWNNKNPLPPGLWQRIWEYPYLALKIPSDAKAIGVGGAYPIVLQKNFPKTISVVNRDFNGDNKHHSGNWPKGKQIVADPSRIPVADQSYDYAFSMSALDKTTQTLDILKEMIRVTRYRVIVTVDVSDGTGTLISKLREIEAFLGCPIPRVPTDSFTSTSNQLRKYGQKTTEEGKATRVLAFTIDSCDCPKSIGVLVPHWNSWDFLIRCVENIKANKSPTLIEKIYILDDESTDGSYEKIIDRYGNDEKITICRIKRWNKKTEPDVGLLLDEGLKLVEEQYVAMIDADLFPLSQEWLAFPIWLLEKYNCSSVGVDTGLSAAYANCVRNEWWQPRQAYIPCAGLYDNEWFTCTNNLYRVMRTSEAKVVSENIGFTRATSMIFGNSRHRIVRGFSRAFRWLANSPTWSQFCNRRYPYLPGGEDNGVAANHFMDVNRMGPKFNIPITGYIGETPRDGVFGQNICGLVFHFALSTRALSEERREVTNAGEEYYYWCDKINKEGLASLAEMIEASAGFKPGIYLDEIPAAWYEKEYSYIHSLLEEYRRECYF